MTLSRDNDSRRPKLGKWAVVTGPHAFCDACSWAMNGDDSSKRLMSAARFHARDTGHSIQVQRGQMAVMRG